MEKKTRLLIAEDHVLVRAGICALLVNVSWIEVVAEADNGIEALHLVQQLMPDIVLLDIAMPQLGGLEVTERIRSDFPDISVIILSMHNNEEYVLRALQKGASGYLLKDASPTELEKAIRSVRDGQTYLSQSISKIVIQNYLHLAGTNNQPEDPSLTPRQLDVLRLIAHGLTTKQIAATLKISVKSVETHRTMMMNKLDIHNVAGLVRYAVHKGLISLSR